MLEEAVKAMSGFYTPPPAEHPDEETFRQFDGYLVRITWSSSIIRHDWIGTVHCDPVKHVWRFQFVTGSTISGSRTEAWTGPLNYSFGINPIAKIEVVER